MLGFLDLWGNHELNIVTQYFLGFSDQILLLRALQELQEL